MKYQIMIHHKDDAYETDPKNRNPQYEEGYIISFKGIFDTIKSGLDFVFNKYSDVLRGRHIALDDIANHMTITRIDPVICEKWERLYLDKSREGC